MKIWKAEAESFKEALRLAASVAIGTLALVAMTSAASVGLIGWLLQSGVMTDAREAAEGFFDYYANSVGLAVAFVAGLATIFLALQALRVASNQTALAARQTFNEDMREFRKEIKEADQLMQQIAETTMTYAFEVHDYITKNYHPALRTPPELDEDKVHRLLEFARVNLDDDASFSSAVSAVLCERRREAGKEVESSRDEWSTAILRLFQQISASNNPIFASLIRRNLESKPCQDIIEKLREPAREIEQFVQTKFAFQISETRPSTVLAEISAMISGPAFVNYDKPFLSEEEYSVAKRPSTPFTLAQFQINTRSLPRPGLANLPLEDRTEDPNHKLSYDPKCSNLLLYIPLGSDTKIPADLYERQSKGSALLRKLHEADAAANPMLQQVRKHAEETSFAVVFDLLLRLLSTENLESYLQTMIKETGVDSRIASTLAKQYARDFPDRQSLLA
jgi:hypothetical protein